MNDPRVKNRSMKALFDHIGLEITPAERESELFGKIKDIAMDYHTKKHDEYKKNANQNRFCFGKYKSKLIQSVFHTEKGNSYCSWLMMQPFFKERFIDNYEYLLRLMRG